MPSVTDPAPPGGRPRDRSIDQAVLDVTLCHLATHGVSGLSVAAVAEEAGTTRPAVYRRWPNKLDLVVAAVASLAEAEPPTPTGDHFADLVAELEHFRHCITDARALALAGIMLTDGAGPELRERYRENLVRPRRARLRAHLVGGITSGSLDPEADLEVAGSLLTGSWYAYALSGTPVPADWARRTAALAWRACGGNPPD